MSIAKNASRFDFLMDDADDPFQAGSKKNKKKDGSGGSGDASKKKASKKGNVNSDKKQLQSLAFGSVSEGKKKSKPGGTSQQNGNSSTKLIPDNVDQSKEQRNGNCNERSPGQRPKGISDEQWMEWQKRDSDNVDEAYATELQEALFQSKLDYETEQKNKPQGKGKKKKPVAVSLTDFNARLNEGGPPMAAAASAGLVNGSYNFSSYGSHNQVQQPYETDEELVERFRLEARLELERERKKAIERQIIMSRQPPPPIELQSISEVSQPVPTASLDEKDVLVSRLTEENLQLKSEVDMLKSRVKAINNYLQAAQEVKDKAKLIYEVENLTKANSDLNEEMRQLHSQLEQEKSRSSAAMLELRRLLENRRRTATEGSNS